MPESTDLNISPYFDDWTPNNEYYKILFQPGVSVQVRELNVLQSMLQNQVEKFGDNLLTKGTIVSGCTFQFFPQYPYVKLRDNDLFGVPVIPSSLVGFFAESTNTGLRGIIVNYADGFESQLPALKTLFVTYLNGGTSGNTHVFSPGETLLITDANVAIWTVNVVSSGISFSNSDFPVFTPALVVNVTSGSFSNGDFVTQPSTGANLQIVGIDSSSLALAGQTILSLVPRNVDLANAAVNANAWAVANNDSIHNAGNTAVGTILAVVGDGAAGTVLTDGSGRILQIPLATGGAGYEDLPTVAIRSIGNPTGLAAANLVAQNFLTKVVVANTADAAANGYAFGVGEGVIYQKGYFLRANPQVIVIDKYDTTPNNISVGFHSVESIVTPQQDPSLYDNALGTQNFQAPGANRLQIIPELTVIDPNTDNSNFFSLVVWSEGNPFLQRQDTSYGVLERHLAQREFETAGNFAVDQFKIATRSPSNTSFEGTNFSIVVDPGVAYVDGYRVETQRNFVISDRKGLDSNTLASVTLSLNYDDYLIVNNCGGVFQFTTADTLDLYDTAKLYAGNAATVEADDITPAGTKIGTARMRSMIRNNPSGIPGTGSDQYRLYLFDLHMANGQSFSSVKGVHYNNQAGGANGVADVVLTNTGTTGGGLICQYANTLYDTLLFPTKVQSVQSVNNVTYTYRTIDQSLHFSNAGILTKTLTGSEYFPWANGTSLTTDQLLTMYVVPIGKDMQATANLVGTVNASTTSANILGNATTFLSDLVPGDYVYVFSNSTVHEVRKVTAVINNTVFSIDSNSAFSVDSCAYYRWFPKYLPIPFGPRSGLTGNIDSTGQVLTLSLGFALTGSATINAAVGVDIVRQNVTYGTKTAARHQKVVIKISNNVGGNTGPWSLGVSDVMRMRSVTRITGTAPPYANDTQVAALGHDVTRHFYVDQRQNQDYLDLSQVCVKPDANLGLGSTDYLVVDFDAFQVSSNGYYVTPSYVTSNSAAVSVNDSLPLANLGSIISSWEIPIVPSGKDSSYYDLLNCFDFRPIAANTASSTSNVNVATVNPAIILDFGNTASVSSNRKFPSPDSVLTTDITYYQGRKDRVILGPDTTIAISQGQPGTRGPNPQSNTMSLGLITIPPYPCLPQYLSDIMGEVITLRVRGESKRLRPRTITTPSAANTVLPDQPKQYNMGAIQGLEARIRNLEYYQSLSAMQTDMVKKVIPSGNDPSIDRFKYGLFVDNFSNSVSQEIDDPQYMATIMTGALTPEIVSWHVRHGVENISNPYVDFPIVIQTSATGTANLALTAALPGWLLRIDADQVLGIVGAAGNTFTNHGSSNPFTLIDTKSVQFAANAAVATLYFFVPKSTLVIQTEIIEHGHPDPDRFLIYQGNTLIKSTTAGDAQSLTSADVTYLHSNAVPADWFNGTALAAGNLTNANGFVSGSGKISWTHNPAGGNQYTIQSQKLTRFDHWRWALSYPGPSATIPAPTVLANGAVSFLGTIYADPDTFALMLLPQGALVPPEVPHNIQIGNPGYKGPYFITGATQEGGGIAFSGAVKGAEQNQYWTPGWGGHNSYAVEEHYMPLNTTLVPQSFQLFAVGLKAGTTHSFKVNGVDQGSFCRPFGKSLGDPITTDQYGTASFDFFYPGLIDTALTLTLLSTTAPIVTTWVDWWWQNASNPAGGGNVMMELVAPNSVAIYQMTLGVSPEIPLKLLKHVPQ